MSRKKMKTNECGAQRWHRAPLQRCVQQLFTLPLNGVTQNKHSAIPSSSFSPACDSCGRWSWPRSIPHLLATHPAQPRNNVVVPPPQCQDGRGHRCDVVSPSSPVPRRARPSVRRCRLAVSQQRSASWWRHTRCSWWVTGQPRRWLKCGHGGDGRPHSSSRNCRDSRRCRHRAR